MVCSVRIMQADAALRRAGLAAGIGLVAAGAPGAG